VIIYWILLGMLLGGLVAAFDGKKLTWVPFTLWWAVTLGLLVRMWIGPPRFDGSMAFLWNLRIGFPMLGPVRILLVPLLQLLIVVVCLVVGWPVVALCSRHQARAGTKTDTGYRWRTLSGQWLGAVSRRDLAALRGTRYGNTEAHPFVASLAGALVAACGPVSQVAGQALSLVWKAGLVALLLLVPVIGFLVSLNMYRRRYF